MLTDILEVRDCAPIVPDTVVDDEEVLLLLSVFVVFEERVELGVVAALLV
jgi:hypothetical protein